MADNINSNFTPLVLGLEQSCPRPREGLSSKRLSLALASDFFCVLGLGLELCVFDSTSAWQYRTVHSEFAYYVPRILNRTVPAYRTSVQRLKRTVPTYRTCTITKEAYRTYVPYCHPCLQVLKNILSSGRGHHCFLIGEKGK